MRRRFVLASLAVSLVSLLLLCVPLGLISQSLIAQDFNHRLDRNLQSTAAAIVELTAAGRGVTESDLAALVPSGRRATYTPDRGAAVFAGHIAGPARAAQVTLPAGTLQMSAPLSLLHGRELRIWLLIAGLGLLATASAASLSFWLATRMSRPLRTLAATAERFGRGDLRPSGLRYQISELDTLAEVLDQSAASLAQRIDHERRLAREATHSLRTPLTSLAVRLEEIHRTTSDHTIRIEAQAALRQVERLSDVVSAVLAQRARHTPASGPVDVSALLRAQQREWQPAFTKAGRDIVLAQTEPSAVEAMPGALEQAVATLIENALIHGSGTATLSARLLGTHVSIDVSDEGAGVPDALGQHIFVRGVSGARGTGLGLPLARALVEADGGRLELTRAAPPRFSIFLPAAATDADRANTRTTPATGGTDNRT